MDDRQVSHPMHPRRTLEGNCPGHIQPQRFSVVGWREHQVLVAEGHYRCPICRRVDTMEVNVSIGYPAR